VLKRLTEQQNTIAQPQRLETFRDGVRRVQRKAPDPPGTACLAKS
jgi:hypothetical protein